MNQRTHPTCIYNVYEYFTTGHELTIHEKNYFLTLIKHYFCSQFYNYMYTCYLEIIKWTRILGGAHAPHAPSKSATDLQFVYNDN
jgi:hypothetical protein